MDASLHIPQHDTRRREGDAMRAQGRPSLGARASGSAAPAPVDRPTPARSAIALRSEGEIELMHSAGQVVRAALRAAARACVPGATTASADAAAAGVIAAFRAEPLFLNHRAHDHGPPFPASTCISVNDEIVHGVPGPRRLRAGDLVSIDCGVRLRGWCADAATTIVVGEPDSAAPACLRMVEMAEQLLESAIASIAPGVAWSSIAERLEQGAIEHGYGIVVEFMGHGIGRELHEPPQAPNALVPGFREHDDFTLRPGITLAIEPMLVLGGGAVSTRTLEDGWTVAVADGRPACHVEHTVAVTSTGVRVLTGPVRPSVREELALLH